MKLKRLRQHYAKKADRWVPKKAYDTKADVFKELGKAAHIYSCGICKKLHVASYPPVEKVE